MAALAEHQLRERHPGLGEQHEILGGNGLINGITERGLGKLFLATGEQLPGALDVFEGLHDIPAPMDDSRLTELELRYMQQAELLQQLSDVLYTQQKAMDVLKAEVELLKNKLAGDPGLVDAKQLERPPHY